MSSDYSINQSAENLGVLIQYIAVLFIAINVVSLCFKDIDKSVSIVSLVLAVIMILGGYGISKKNHLAYWVVFVMILFYMISALIDIVVGSGLVHMDNYNVNWFIGICELIASGILMAYVVGSKGNVLN